MNLRKSLIILLCLLALISGRSNKHHNKKEDLFKIFETEKIDITGEYSTHHEFIGKYIRVGKKSSVEMELSCKKSEDYILWMKARIIDASNMSFYINNRKLAIKRNLYYFKWIKLGDFNKIDDIKIKIENDKSLIEIDKFVISKNDIAPFDKEYVIDDIVADTTENKEVKLFFSGDELKNADVYLYRKLTVEGYLNYLKDKYKRLSNYKKFIMVFQHNNSSYSKINSTKILENNNYFIIDENPTKYQCRYYLQVDNKFGQSLRSRNIIVDYNKDNNSVLEVRSGNLTSYDFKRYENDIKYHWGFIQETEKNKKLYLNKKTVFTEIPLFLNNTYYYYGLSDTENVAFNVNKPTDVYIYVPDHERSYKEYYYEKGYELVRIPVSITDNDKNYSYFYHKKYRPGTGDAVYMENPKKIEEQNDAPFSTYISGNDLTVYFNDIDTLLANSEKIFIKYTKKYNHYNFEENDDDKYDDLERCYKDEHKIEMTKINDNLWKYNIKNGAVKYKELIFEFYNENDVWENDPEWTWNLEDYICKNKFKRSSVIFFKELEKDDTDINFNNKYQSGYLDLEDYLIDDGEVFSVKARNQLYGFNKHLEVKNNAEISKDNTKGFNNEGLLEIEYNSLNSELIDSDYIRIIYSYDNWTTIDNILMQNTAYNKWITQLYPPSGSPEISFYFTNDEIIDNNQDSMWYWDFLKQKSYNVGYRRNIVKKNYIELPKFIEDSDENYEWKIEKENGIYDISLLIEMTDKEDSAVIEINGKSYELNKSYKEAAEIRDRILVYNNKIILKNTGNQPVKIYEISVKLDRKLITDRIFYPENFESDTLIENDGCFIFKNNNDIIKTDFELENISAANKIELVFDASSTNSDLIYLSTNDNYDNDDLVGIIKLNNDLKEYKIDISSYINEIRSSGNVFTIYIKGNKGTKVLTGKNETAPFILKSYIVLDEKQEVYQAMGVISHNGTNYIFDKDNSAESYISYSDNIKLDDHFNALVMVTGYLDNNVLNIIKVAPVITIKSIEGDTYTNNQPLKWDVISDQPLTGLKYRIKGVCDWTIMTYGTIIQEVPEDGEYLLEVIPMMNGAVGVPASHSFTVDRTGPQLIVTENIPDYTSETQFNINLEYTDNFSSIDEIKTYYKINSAEETELNVENGKTVLFLPEGKLNVEIYCKDFLGNIGNVYKVETIVDTTRPEITNVELKYNFGDIGDENGVEKYQLVRFDCSSDDNFTELGEIVFHYKIEDQFEWRDTTSDWILFDFKEFEDGEYQFSVYAEDKGGLTSDVYNKKFIIDTVPIEKPSYYKAKIFDNKLQLNWESKNDDPTFNYYQIIEDQSNGIVNNKFKVQKNEFIDSDSFYNNEKKYILKVFDIYGNESEPLECYSMNFKEVSGNIGDIKTLVFDEGTFSFEIDNHTPKKIGVIKKEINFNKIFSGEYKFIENKVYQFGPSGAVFSTPAIWKINLNDLNDVENKNNLTFYKYNKIKNIWEEAESYYNEQDNTLEAKIYHFSTYGVGEKKDNTIEEPKQITNISSRDGSLNAQIDIFNMISHKGNYKLQLDFNTKKFTETNKWLFDENKIELFADLGGFKHMSMILWEKAWSMKNSMQHPIQKLNSYWNLWLTIEKFEPVFEPEDHEKISPLSLTTLMNYEESPRHFNYIDNAWDINIPKLIPDFPDEMEVNDETSDEESEEILYNMKNIKFEDGTSYELKPYEGEHRNRIGKKFIFKEITKKIDDEDKRNGFLVKLSNYKNYRFDNKGNIKYIFFSDDPESKIDDIDNNLENNIFDKCISYSFNYDDEGILEYINSHDIDGKIYNRIYFEYATENDGENTDIFIKKLSNITNQVKNDNDDYKTISKLKLEYEKTDKKLRVYSHDKNNKSFTIDYERFQKIDYEYYKNDKDEILETEEKIVNYELNGTEYNKYDIFHEEFPIELKDTITLNMYFYVFGRDLLQLIKSLGTWGWFLTKDDYVKIPIEFPVFEYSCTDEKYTSLSKITIDEKDYKSEYYFKDYKRIDNWNIYNSFIHSYCTDKKIFRKNETKLSKSFETKYYYQKNPDSVLSPFSKTLKVNENINYSLNKIDYNLETENTNYYYFKESVIDKVVGPKENLSGRITGSFDEEDFNKRYFPDDESSDAENIIDIIGSENVEYSKNKILLAGDSTVLAMSKYIKQSEKDEVIFQNEKFEYYMDEYNGQQIRSNRLKQKLTYLNNTEKKISEYTYIDNNSNDLMFLSPVIYETKNQLDNDLYEIENFSYEDGFFGQKLISKKEKRLSDNLDKNYASSEFLYNENSMVEKIISIDSDGNERIINEYEYDKLGNTVKNEIIGKTKIESNGNIEDGSLNKVTNNYYDNKTNGLIATEIIIDENNTKTFSLYFYDYNGRNYKSVNIDYDNGVITDNAIVTINYNNEYFNNDIYITGSCSKFEASSKYEEYINNILSNKNYSSFQDTEYENYLLFIEDLKSIKFDYSNYNDFISASQKYHYFSYIIYVENFKKDISSNYIEKRYTDLKVDTSKKIIEKHIDTLPENEKEKNIYDGLGNITRIEFPGNYIPPVEYITMYDNYSMDKVTRYYNDTNGQELKLSYLKRYNNSGNVIYEKIDTTDNSVGYDDFYEYDFAGRLKRSTSIDGIVIENQYEYFGLNKSLVTGKDGFSKVTSRNVFDSIGNSTNSYSSILINSTSFNLDDDWISKKHFDDFGNVIKKEAKYDNKILKNPVEKNIILETAYNIYGKPEIQKTNIYNNKLDEKKFEYTYFGQIKKIIYYDWDPENNKAVEFSEEYYYDKYKRLKETIIKKDNNEIIKRIIVGNYDQNNNLISSYVIEKGQNWVEIFNKYNISGNTIYNRIRVLNNNNINADKTNLSSANDLLVKEKYNKYDKYQRLIAAVDYNGDGKYIIYDAVGNISKEYIGINFKYNIDNSTKDIINITTGVPIEYEYNDNNLLIKKRMVDGNEILYNKEYGYDKYGRMISETMDRYVNGAQKKKLTTYDSISRIKTIIADNITTTITKWEDDPLSNMTNEIQISIADVDEPLKEIVKYTEFGNVEYSIDRYNYEIKEKIDEYGNITEQIKNLISDNNTIINIFNSEYEYTDNGLFLVNEKIISELGIDKELIYKYDSEGRINNIKNYDLDPKAIKTEKNYTYEENNNIGKVEIIIEGESYSLDYLYNESGELKSIIYPENKVYELDINYGINDPEKDGKLKGIYFDGQKIIDEVKYLNEGTSFRKSSIISSYKNKTEVKTSFKFDALSRLKSKEFIDKNNDSFSQKYEFDLSGNIKSIKENGTGITDGFTRNFYYDEYNRLIKAEYDGEFNFEINPKLSYQTYDYKEEEEKTSYDNLTDNSENIVNIESKSPSILISDKYGNGRELKPEIIRIYKGSNSKLTETMINPYYHDGNNFNKIENDSYIVNNKSDYYEINNWSADPTKIIKINFDMNNKDENNNPVIDNSLNDKLGDIIKYYLKIDNLDIEYKYDAMGNRLSRKEILSKDNRSVLVDSSEKSYIYNERNQLISDDNYIYEYDNDSYLITKTSIKDSKNYWEYIWSASGNLRKVIKYEQALQVYHEEYVYDESGQRVKTKTVDSTSIYIYDGLKKFFEKTVVGENAKYSYFVYALGELQTTIEDGNFQYYYSDILGSTRFISDSLGNIINESLFTPFGSEILNTMNNDGKQTYFYAGHQNENINTNLTYMNARWMAPGLGRFISPDPVKQGINHYIYAGNNPTTNIDPNGLTYSDYYNIQSYNILPLEYGGYVDYSNYAGHAPSIPNYIISDASSNYYKTFNLQAGTDSFLLNNNYILPTLNYTTPGGERVRIEKDVNHGTDAVIYSSENEKATTSGLINRFGHQAFVIDPAFQYSPNKIGFKFYHTDSITAVEKKHIEVIPYLDNTPYHGRLWDTKGIGWDIINVANNWAINTFNSASSVVNNFASDLEYVDDYGIKEYGKNLAINALSDALAFDMAVDLQVHYYANITPEQFGKDFVAALKDESTAEGVFGIVATMGALKAIEVGMAANASTPAPGKLLNGAEISTSAGTNGNITKYQKHHWWPKELGGADKKGTLVDVPSANPNLHTATGGIHPNMRSYFKSMFGTSTWKAAKVEFFKLEFNTQHQLLQEFYNTQGMNMPSMISPGIIE